MTCKLISLMLGILLMNANLNMITAKSVPQDEEALRAVSTGLSQFSSDFYNTSSKAEEGNLICSPLSAGVVLAMTAFGAKGNTEKQMRETLRMPDGVTSKKGYQSLIDTLNDVKKVQLKLAQKIYTDNDFEVKPEFKELTETYFRSTSESVDFGKPQEASQTINAWCEEKTNNRIKDVVSPDDLEGALIVLINAVYFKGNWVSKFPAYSTSPKPFHVDEKTTKDVDTMYQERSFNYGTLPELDAIYVELPYEHENEDDSISMFIILPNQVGGLQKSTNNLDKVNFQELHNKRQNTLLRLFMPKFKIETTLNLQSVLETMGMSDMFTDNADFRGIADAPPLKISKVIQKAFIEVNEEGSEAAAVTAVVAVAMSAFVYDPPPITVEINRPFMYAIHHTSSNTVLFQGHVHLPSMNIMAALKNQSLQVVANSLSKFSTDFYKTLSEKETANFICSSTSVSMVLSMISFGADGNTKKELHQALYLDNDSQVTRNGFQVLIDILNAVKTVDLRMANKIFAAIGFEIKSEFQAILETSFRSASETLNFDQAQEASNTINQWCENKTNNRIKDVVQPDDLQGAMLVLVNAIYFKGNWVKKFDANLTKPMPFHINTRETKEVPMMKRKGRYNYGEVPGLNAVYIELPYENKSEEDSISMFIILPNDIDGLKNVENDFHKVNYKQLHDNKYSTEIDLQMPKFKIESKFDLQDSLMKMGINEMFDNRANFSKISNSPLKVSKVIQKAFIEVNEEGSEAAAVTAAVMMLRCSMPRPPMAVVVDKPFHCAIVSTNSGIPLFSARIADPSVT
ncbi:uncharacterized protein [Chelonus insularis]|uniref:uncharacterized protein n=1 Tax=Chelonus insularis TaxID=460826 RepID=UPI00158F5030|nr:uncharacterized protein LOC118064601 [Chelonus insularis]